MNTSNYSRLPVTSLYWVGKTVLQDEGELHASLGESSGPWYGATDEKSGAKTQHWVLNAGGPGFGSANHLRFLLWKMGAPLMGVNERM